MTCSTFLKIGKAKSEMTFGDITANRDFAFCSDTIMTLQPAGGRTGNIITYLTAEEAEEIAIPGLTAGWYDNEYMNSGWDWESEIPNEYKFNNKSLPFGTMVVVQGTDGANVNYAGEVVNQNHQFEIIGGQFNMIGNCMPVDIIMGDITANRDFAFCSDTIMTLQPAGGRTGNIITYLTAEEAEEIAIPGLTAGWYDNEYMNSGWDWESEIPAEYKFNNLPIPAGYGFIAQGTDGAIVEIPSPLAD